jgi:hypothetical protein
MGGKVCGGTLVKYTPEYALLHSLLTMASMSSQKQGKFKSNSGRLIQILW